MEKLTVTLGVVALNEENYLPRVLEAFNKQTYPHELIEVILIDGGSADKTREIMNDYALHNPAGFYSIQVLNNPKKIQAAGWNVAIDNFRGDILFRIDAHSYIPADFVALNMANVADGENVVGGPRDCINENDSMWSRMLLSAENSLFGSSFFRKKDTTKITHVDSLFHLGYTRKVLDKVGHFNEKLLRTEDNDFNYRVRAAKFEICCDPKVHSSQYVRSNLRKMIKQKYGNGYWIGATMHENPACISKSHFIPMLFDLAIIAVIVIGLVFGAWTPALLLLGAYFLFGIASMIMAFVTDGFNPALLLLPFIFPILHVPYGVGTIIGLIKGC